MAAGHVRRSPDIIDEDQTLRIEIELSVEPALALPHRRRRFVGCLNQEYFRCVFGFEFKFVTAQRPDKIDLITREGPSTKAPRDRRLE